MTTLNTASGFEQYLDDGGHQEWINLEHQADGTLELNLCAKDRTAPKVRGWNDVMDYPDSDATLEVSIEQIVELRNNLDNFLKENNK
jgi:hypothetical protein